MFKYIPRKGDGCKKMISKIIIKIFPNTMISWPALSCTKPSDIPQNRSIGRQPLLSALAAAIISLLGMTLLLSAGCAQSMPTPEDTSGAQPMPTPEDTSGAQPMPTPEDTPGSGAPIFSAGSYSAEFL